MHAYIPRLASVIPVHSFLLATRNLENTRSTFAVETGSPKMSKEAWGALASLVNPAAKTVQSQQQN